MNIQQAHSGDQENPEKLSLNNCNILQEEFSTNSTNDRTSKGQIFQLNEHDTWKLTNLSNKNKPNNPQNKKNFRSCFGKLQSYLNTENAFEFRFKIIVFLLFLLIVLLVLLTRYFHYNLQIKQAIQNQIWISEDIRRINFLNERGDNLLILNFGMHIPSDIKPINCRSLTQDKICYDWKYRTFLSVKSTREIFNTSLDNKETITCYDFFWNTYQQYSTIKDCFDMANAFWFGMGDISNLKTPLNKMSVNQQPFITNHDTEFSGSIIGRTWFSSNGVMISVPLHVPLFVSINSTEDQNKLCLISDRKHPYYTMNYHNYFVHLKYSICLANNVNTLQNYYYQKNLKKFDESIQEKGETASNQEEDLENVFLDRIIWSTNINVLPNFDQNQLQSYVDQITNYGFGGIILLDPRWEKSIGELKMSEQAFPTPTALINILHNKGFKIMLTVSPNIPLNSTIFTNASEYILLDSHLKTPLLTKCIYKLDQFCALINFTSIENRNHFRKELIENLFNTSNGFLVDGLYFKSIPSSLLPRHINYEHNINPDQFINYMSTVIKTLKTSIGLSVSVDPRNFSGYATIYPRESSWKGLRSIIPSVLSLGLIGYPLVNTGVVGGKDLFVKIKNNTDYINKELYLRWLQVAVFLPVVEFGEPPGGNDLEVIKIAKRLLKVRSEHFLPTMKQALLEYKKNGSPIIRPMWWAKNHTEAFLIDDQFMIGDEIVVAPIVEDSKTERDIYLPHGWWKDEILAQVIRGGKWMRKYQVPLDKVAFFIRTDTSSMPIN